MSPSVQTGRRVHSSRLIDSRTPAVPTFAEIMYALLAYDLIGFQTLLPGARGREGVVGGSLTGVDIQAVRA